MADPSLVVGTRVGAFAASTCSGGLWCAPGGEPIARLPIPVTPAHELWTLSSPSEFWRWIAHINLAAASCGRSSVLSSRGPLGVLLQASIPGSREIGLFLKSRQKAAMLGRHDACRGRPRSQDIVCLSLALRSPFLRPSSCPQRYRLRPGWLWTSSACCSRHCLSQVASKRQSWRSLHPDRPLTWWPDVERSKHGNRGEEQRQNQRDTAGLKVEAPPLETRHPAGSE